MKNFNFKNFLKDPIATSGGILVFSSIFANFLNFLGSTYLTRSQVVTFDALGVIGLIAGFNTISDVIFGAINKTVMFQTAFLFGKHGKIIKGFWEKVFKFSFLFGILITIIWFISIPFLSRFFSSATLPLILSAPAWLFTLIIVVNEGFLTGAHKFVVMAVMVSSEAAIKLVATILFVQMGHADLVYLAFPLSLLTTFLGGTIYISRLTKTRELEEVPHARKIPKKFFVSSLGFKVAAVLFLAGDVILAKHYLSPTLAGQYILLSTIGKMVYFFGSIFTTFVSPLVSKNEGANKSSKKVFGNILLLTILSNIIPVLGIGVFGFWTIPFIFASKGSTIIAYLLPYTLAMSFFSVAGLITNYHQAKNHNRFAFVSLSFALVQTLGIIFYQHTLNGLVSVIFIVSLIYVLVLLGLHVLYENHETLH